LQKILMRKTNEKRLEIKQEIAQYMKNYLWQFFCFAPSSVPQMYKSKVVILIAST